MADIRLKKITVENAPLIIQNGIISISDTSLNSVSLTGGLEVGCTAESTFNTNGGIVLVGGMGIGRNLQVGGDIVGDNTNKVFRIKGVSVDRVMVDTITNKNIKFSVDGLNTDIELTDTNFKINVSKSSTNSTTGGVIVEGGISINNTNEATSETNGGGLTNRGGMGILKNVYIGGGLTTINSSNTIGNVITTTNGNVGIGISNPTYNLDVRDTVRVGSSNGTLIFTQTSSGNIEGRLDINGGTNTVTGGSTRLYSRAEDATFGVYSNSFGRTQIRVVSNETVGNDSLRLLERGGKVGIALGEGIGGTYTLEVNGDTRIRATRESTNTSTGALLVNGGVAVQKSLYVGNGIISTNESSNTIGSVITSPDGNVGIGDGTPSYKLDTNGEIRSWQNINGENSVIINNDNAGTSAYSALKINNNGGTGAILFLNSTTRTEDGGPNVWTMRNNAGHVRIQSADQTTMIFLNTNGNVGIGTTSPVASLNVIGGIEVSQNFTSTNIFATNITSSNLFITNITNNNSIINSGTITNLRTNTITSGTIRINSGALFVGTTSWTTNGDDAYINANSGIYLRPAAGSASELRNFNTDFYIKNVNDVNSVYLDKTTDYLTITGGTYIIGGISSGSSKITNAVSNSITTGTLNVTSDTSLASIVRFKDSSFIGHDTTDGSDNRYTILSGGGGDGASRGGRIVLSGNEIGGGVKVMSGTNGNIEFMTNEDQIRGYFNVDGLFTLNNGLYTTTGTISNLNTTTLTAGNSRIIGTATALENYGMLTVENNSGLGITMGYDTTIGRGWIYSRDVVGAGKQLSINNLMFVENSVSNVGINNSSPSYKLDVNGTMRVTGNTYISSTTQSSANNNGALVVDGGVGIAKNVYIGGNAVITGDLIVSGSTNSVSSINMTIEDNIIVLNSGPAGSKDAGIIIHRYQIDNNSGSGDVVNDSIYKSDTLPAQGVVTSSEVKLSTSASGVDSYYVGWWIKVTSGLNNNQVRKITAYNGTTKIATISSVWTTQNPTIGDVVFLYNKPYVGMLYDEINDRFELGGLATEVTAGNIAITNNSTLHLHDITVKSTEGGSLTVLGGGSIASDLVIGGDAYVGGAVFSSSDIRLKDNISSLRDKFSDNSILEKIDKIRSITHTYKRDDKKEKYVGFIAQDFIDNFPELLRKDVDDYYSLDYQKVTVILLECIKELYDKVKELNHV